MTNSLAQKSEQIAIAIAPKAFWEWLKKIVLEKYCGNMDIHNGRVSVVRVRRRISNEFDGVEGELKGVRYGTYTFDSSGHWLEEKYSPRLKDGKIVCSDEELKDGRKE